MSQEEKMKRVDDMLEYFYNFWKVVEKTNSKIEYTLHFNTSLIAIWIPMGYYLKLRDVFNSLKPVFKTNLVKTYFKVENNLAKTLINLVLSLYTPVKPVHII